MCWSGSTRRRRASLLPRRGGCCARRVGEWFWWRWPSGIWRRTPGSRRLDALAVLLPARLVRPYSEVFARSVVVGHQPKRSIDRQRLESGDADDNDSRAERLGQVADACQRSLCRAGAVVAGNDRLHASRALVAIGGSPGSGPTCRSSGGRECCAWRSRRVTRGSCPRERAALSTLRRLPAELMPSFLRSNWRSSACAARRLGLLHVLLRRLNLPPARHCRPPSTGMFSSRCFPDSLSSMRFATRTPSLGNADARASDD